MNVIDRFTLQYRFLSNFYPARVTYCGFEFPTVEHAYQAAKSDDPGMWEAMSKVLKPGDAKTFGRNIRIRSGWEDMKLYVMRELLVQKFDIPALREKLLATGDALLIEGNSWNDTFWGMCAGQGKNHLGRLLMEIRSALNDLSSAQT